MESWRRARLGPGAAWRWIAACLLIVHAGLLAWGAWRHSPTNDEICYLPAGISHWTYGRFELAAVNPPLVRMLSALPVLVAKPQTDWTRYSTRIDDRSWFAVGRDFMRANGPRSFWLYTLARWACIPWSLLGAYVAGRWASELYGRRAGLVAMTLWCFCPNILAHGQMITPDVATAAVCLLASYTFWHWLRRPEWLGAFAAGTVLGLAQLTKTTLIVLFVLWPVLWVLWAVRRPTVRPSVSLRMQAVQLAGLIVLSVYVLNLGYGFEGSFTRLGDYSFVSGTLRGETYDERDDRSPENRFYGTWLGVLPVPLPKDYLCGIDVQKWSFELNRPSYLRGQWRDRGWWWYYLYGLAIKVPLGTWLLLALAVACKIRGRCRPVDWRAEVVLLAPGVAILLFVSSQTGFSRHVRYVLAILPFVFIWISQLARADLFRRRLGAQVAVAAVAWSIASSLFVFPHSLSYFNELVGGPKGGHWHLNSSNIDWGQDLLYLQRWLRAHPEVSLDGFEFGKNCDPGLAGIDVPQPPPGPDSSSAYASVGERPGPCPGWYAVGVDQLHSQHAQYSYFLHFRPAAMAGYSIYIYHIRPDEAEAVRRCNDPEMARERGSACLGGKLSR